MPRRVSELRLHGAERTDLFVEAAEFLAQLLEAIELGNLLLRFAQSGGIGETLRDGVADGAAAQLELRTAAGIVRLGAMAGVVTTASDHGGNRARADSAQAQELFEELGSVSF